MEIIIFIAVIALICFIIGVSAEAILLGGLILLTVLLAVITVFFVINTIKLITSEACKGEFVKIDKNSGGNFDTAYYAVNGIEYPNIFPCEIILRNKIYKKNKTVNLRLNKNKKNVFDKNAIVTTITGIFLGTISLIYVINILLDFI